MASVWDMVGCPIRQLRFEYGININGPNSRMDKTVLGRRRSHQMDELSTEAAVGAISADFGNNFTCFL